MNNRDAVPNRRDLLKALGAAGIAGIAGCSGNGEEEDGTTTTEDGGGGDATNVAIIYAVGGK
ncbi:MAG: twin-arginine translocation signal domain-containing protein, partial [Halodesulfurarchaeum sp.]